MRKLLIGAAFALLLLIVLPFPAWLVIVALAVGAYAIFGMREPVA